jgi:hypothetical protein
MVRRIVTGHDETGAAVFLSDGVPPRTQVSQHVQGSGQSLIWATEGSSTPSSDDPTPTVTSYVPGPGSTIALTVTFPPASAFADPGIDWAAFAGEQASSLPGLAERFEPDAPGMHTTPTVDYAVVLEGDIDLTLDNGVSTSLRPGDVVVQNATRHGWMNPYGEPATIFVVLIGASPA